MNRSWIHPGRLFQMRLYHLGGLFLTPLYHLHPCRQAFAGMTTKVMKTS